MAENTTPMPEMRFQCPILSGVVSYPQILLLDLTEDSPLFKPLKLIQQSGERAAAIVHDLLTMARRAVETMVPVEVKDVMDNYFQSPEFSILQANLVDRRCCRTTSDCRDNVKQTGLPGHNRQKR